MKRIAAIAAVLVALFGTGARASAAAPVYVECFDAFGTDWFVPVELVDPTDPVGCAPLIADGPLPAPPPPDAPPAPEAPPDTGSVDVGFDADPNIAPNPALYATEVRCPDGSIWAVVKGDAFVCPMGSP